MPQIWWLHIREIQENGGPANFTLKIQTSENEGKKISYSRLEVFRDNKRGLSDRIFVQPTNNLRRKFFISHDWEGKVEPGIWSKNTQSQNKLPVLIQVITFRSVEGESAHLTEEIIRNNTC